MYRPHDLPGVEIWDVKNTRQCLSIFHEMYTICNILEFSDKGSGNWKYRQQFFDSESGDTMLMEPGEMHSTKNISTMVTYQVAQLSPHLILDAARRIGLKGIPHLKTVNLHRHPLHDAFTRFHRALQNTGASTLERESRLTHAIHLMLETCAEGSPNPLAAPPPKAMLRARDYLCTHFNKKVALDELASIAGVSRFHFLRAFQKTFNAPPHAFQNHLRIAKARELLAKGVPPAAIDVGFSDQSHLTRTFRRWLLGVTPASYANATRRGSSKEKD
jgi:AraC-like DNA-binding protein